MTIQALAKQYEVSDYSIRIILRKAGVEPTHRRTPPEKFREVRALWSKSVSVAQIAERVEIGQTNVRMILATESRSPAQP